MTDKKRKNNKKKIWPRKETQHDVTEKNPVELWEDMNRLFDQFRSHFEDFFWQPTREETIQTWSEGRTPLLDLADHGEEYELNLELPGIPKENIDVEVSPNMVEVSAEHEDTTEEKSRHWLRRERGTQRFYRSLGLPEEVLADKAEAEMKDGVLTVSLPKKEPKPKQESKKIDIK